MSRMAKVYLKAGALGFVKGSIEGICAGCAIGSGIVYIINGRPIWGAIHIAAGAGLFLDSELKISDKLMEKILEEEAEIRAEEIND